ncbi:sec24-related protein [Auriculariales sp. MPI-PUGE-AT-0066]|nr:sec24-related protein [Auriculariales sp. MPI-PUGE-AT-0066]
MTAISQPPHSAGQRFQGLRSVIDNNIIPSPVHLNAADVAQWASEPYATCESEHAPPMAATPHVALDQGNSAPRFVRMTTYAMPKDSELATTCAIPIAASFQPFAAQPPQELPVPLVSYAVPRCEKCRGFVSAWCSFTDGGMRWKCNLCAHSNPIPEDYFSHLDPQTMRRADHEQRPELSYGTVDIDVSQEYWSTQYQPSVIEPQFAALVKSTAGRDSVGGPSKPVARPPVRLRTLFVIETTAEAVESGFTRAACAAIRVAVSDGFMGDVGIMTYDKVLGFYILDPQQTALAMLVVSELEEVFCPVSDGLFVDPLASHHLIDKLLDDIPDRLFAQTTARSSAFLPATRAALAALAHTGGHVVSFIHSLPSLGPGTLTPRADESAMQGTSKEREMFAPRDQAYATLADECARAGVGVSLVVGCRRWVDLGTLGVLSNYTGGEIAFYPTFAPERDAVPMARRVWSLTRNARAYDCSVKVRCSKALSVDSYSPMPPPSAPSDTLSLGVLRSDLAIQATLSHGYSGLLSPLSPLTGGGGDTLDERQPAYVQCATLYTDAATGNRRVRVINLAVPVSGLAGNVFRGADCEAVALWLARRTLTRTAQKPLQELKDEIAERAASMMLAYRRNCAAAVAPSQLILPDALKTLPMLALGICKTKGVKGGTVNSDVRNAYAHLAATWGLAALMRHVYPRLLPLHHLARHDAADGEATDDSVEVEVQALRAGHSWMEAEGIYLLDNGVHSVLWIGYSVDPALLQDLFGVPSVLGVPNWGRDTHALPELDNPTSRRIRAIIDCEAHGQLLFARQNEDANEVAFGDMLVEDSNNDGLSYVDYLCFLYKHITAALKGDTTVGQQMGFRAPVPW